MQSYENPFIDPSDFRKEIKFPTMMFKNKEFEKEYDFHKFEKKNILVLLGMTIFFNIYQVGIRSILGFLIDFFAMRAITITMPTSITFMVLCNLPFVIESVIFFIDKLRILRGFAINIFPMIAIIIYSQEYCNEVYHTATPMFIITTIVYLPIGFITALIYSANWICGVIQITLYNTVIIIGIWIMPGKVYLDKPWFMLMMISSAFSCCITLYYFEYFQRKCIYLKVVAEKQKKDMMKVLDGLPAPIIISKEGLVIYANKAFKEIPTHPSELQRLVIEHEGFPSSHIFPQSEIVESTHEIIYNKLEKIVQTPIKIPLSNLVKSNTEFNSPSDFHINHEEEIIKHFEISTYSILFPPFKSIVYFFNDLTNSDKVIELKIIDYKNWLHFASVTHDFNTPIGIILGNAEQLSEKVKNKEKKSSLTNISNAASILSLLVQDLLYYAQLKSESAIKITCSYFNLKYEIEEFKKLFDDKYHDKGLYLDLEFSPVIINDICNDLNRIKQIILNLLSNALKFTKKGGVTVIIEEIHERNLIAVSVKDSGIGIPQRYINKLFTEYIKIEKPPEISSRGVGLGLYKCKKLVNLLGGDIKVTSSENFGTVVTFTFKKNLDSFPDPPPIPNPIQLLDIQEPSGSNIGLQSNSERLFLPPPSIPPPILCKCSKILIVDDENQFRKVLKHYANKCELPFDEAENGKRALELVKNKLKNRCCRTYQYILLDYEMPDMNGIVLAIKIRDLLLHIPKNRYKIIIISGKILPDPDDRNPPFDSFETKPILLHKFKRILGIPDDERNPYKQ